MKARPEDFPPLPEGWVRLDHTFTPELAAAILDQIPKDSYHWRDIPRKQPDGVERLTRIMAAGKWEPQLVEHGWVHHPVRWDETGITHGVIRLIACRDSGVSFRAAVEGPREMLAQVLDIDGRVLVEMW